MRFAGSNFGYRGHNRAFRLSMVGIFSGLIAIPNMAASAPLELICGNQQSDAPLHVELNLEAASVTLWNNYLPRGQAADWTNLRAKVDNDKVTWSAIMRHGNSHTDQEYTLDRSTGTLTTWSKNSLARGNGNTSTAPCSKAQKLF